MSDLDDPHRAPAQPERRAMRAEDVAALVEESLSGDFAMLQKNIVAHIDESNVVLQKSITTQINSAVKEAVEAALAEHVKDAFPDGPLYKHREFHEGRIKSAEAGDKIRADLIGWAYKGGLTLLGGMLLLGFFEWLKRELTK